MKEGQASTMTRTRYESKEERWRKWGRDTENAKVSRYKSQGKRSKNMVRQEEAQAKKRRVNWGEIQNAEEK